MLNMIGNQVAGVFADWGYSSDAICEDLAMRDIEGASTSSLRGRGTRSSVGSTIPRIDEELRRLR